MVGTEVKEVGNRLVTGACEASQSCYESRSAKYFTAIG